MGCTRWKDAGEAALSAAILVALLAGVGQARSFPKKPWAEWAPAPLASDSSYVALTTRPLDSLSDDERAWVAVQQDWRDQRSEESATAATIAESWHPHHPRRTDGRFAQLASQPYSTLTDTDRAWLVAENAAQHNGTGTVPADADHASTMVGVIILGALLGFLVGVVAFAYALSHTEWLW